ncbi:MAG: glycosyltransferase family 2 protein [Pirellula sp.]|jgi:GT2 family glycosyltransferase
MLYRTTIIIVSYNTREMTLECLRSLFALTPSVNGPDPKTEVIVWDNQSSDGSADSIEAEFGTRVRLIKSEENLGFAAANNEAAKLSSAEFLLLLNPDTVILDDGLDRLVDFAIERPKNGIYGGRTLFGDRTLNSTSCWSKMSVWSLICHAVGLTAAFPRSNLFDREAIGSWQRDSIREVDIVTGCLFCIRRELWAELGGFRLKYFMYGEEADLCLRSKRIGCSPVITPDCTIVHYVGASSSKSERKVCMVAKAKATLIRDHWPKMLQPIGILLLWFWAASRRLGSSLFAMTKKTNKTECKDKWKLVWKNRKDWLSGYE